MRSLTLSLALVGLATACSEGRIDDSADAIDAASPPAATAPGEPPGTAAADSEPADSAAATTPTAAPAPPPRELAAAEPAGLPPVGEYRVAGVDHHALDLPHGVSVSIARNRIDLRSDCLRYGWSVAAAGGGFATTRLPIVTCQRGLYPDEEAMIEAIDAARRYTRTPANGYELEGGGHSVTLFTQ
jgi:hypothetical protein